MAGVSTKSGTDFRKTMNKFTAGIGSRLETRSKQTAIRAGIVAQAAVRNVIMTTPSDINPAKPNRYDTGYMYDRVGHSTTFRHQRYTVKFGWIDSHKQYFLTQDTGGLAFGKYPVTGMFALRAGLRAAQNVLESDLGKVAKKK